MLSIFLTLVFFLPMATAGVDCRTACLTCRIKDQPPAMLEIYCAMCQECKERRKDRLKTQLARKLPAPPSIDPATQNKDHHVQQLDNNIAYAYPPPSSTEQDDVYQPIPEGCPTAPPCSDEEDPPMITRATTIVTTTTTTTTTTTPRPTCPPIGPCKKTKPAPPPCFYLPPPPPPCMIPPCCVATPPNPPAACMTSPCSAIPVYNQPVLQYPVRYMPPQHPYPPTYGPYSSPQHQLTEQVLSPLNQSDSKTADGDYQYLYVGVPRNLLRKD